VADKLPKVLDAKTHAIMDYVTAAGFAAMAAMFWGRNKRAAIGAAMCAGAITATSLLTDYPGGVIRRLSFRGHRTGDMIQAGLAALGPILLGFGGDAEARYFYGQALSEVGVIAATDWDAA